MAQACLVFDATRICPNATVYVDGWGKSGTLLAINPSTGNAIVKSDSNYGQYSVKITDISVQLPFYSGVKLNETVYPEGWVGAGTVVAFNPHKGTLTVQSHRNYSLNIVRPCDVGQTGHCIVYVQKTN